MAKYEELDSRTSSSGIFVRRGPVCWRIHQSECSVGLKRGASDSMVKSCCVCGFRDWRPNFMTISDAYLLIKISDEEEDQRD
jgi:hypothetical protein